MQIIHYFVFFTTIVYKICSCHFAFTPDSTDLYAGDDCKLKWKDTENGVCKPIRDCDEVLKNIQQRIYNHTICGYQQRDQIVCCPVYQVKRILDTNLIPLVEVINTTATILQIFEVTTKKEIVTTEIPPRETVWDECVVSKTNERGVLRFPKHCPGFVADGTHPQICNFDVCKDLICCPLKNQTNPGKTCVSFGNYVEEIGIRLELNTPCATSNSELNGRFQKTCPTLKMIKNQGFNVGRVCDNKICDDWYCCPRVPANNVESCEDNIYNRKNIEITGPKCIDSKTSAAGTCRPFGRCRTKEFRLFDACFSVPGASFICCPDIDITTRPKLDQQCAEYNKFVYTNKKTVQIPSTEISDDICIPTSPAAGGIPARPLEYPHMAALGYESTTKLGQINWNCGGSIISDRFILTAGHCLVSGEDGPVKVVRLGVLEFNNPLKDDCPEDFEVAERIPHPDYQTRYFYNDIALLKLDRTITFNPYIRPICLPTSSELPKQGMAMGWGAIGPAAPKSDILIKVRQDIYTYAECNETYWFNINRKFTRGIDLDTHVCAGSRTTIESTCPGDSGGPLLMDHPELDQMAQIIGITSFGKACGFLKTPGVYTRVFPYVQWITKIVWGFE